MPKATIARAMIPSATVTRRINREDDDNKEENGFDDGDEEGTDSNVNDGSE